jgi:pentatricopeptide repeat protein
MHRFVVSLLDEVTAMDVDAKKALYPMLVSGLVEQRYVELGKYAKEIYFQMVEDGMDMKNGWLNNLLAVAKYNRQDDLPFHDIMKRLYDQGGNIHSQILLPVIHIMFPYTDAEQMTVALKVWLDVETRNREHSTDNDGRPAARHGPYRIDLSTLEMISAGAARAASVDLILLVWDVIDFCQYEPTEMIFENTVATFASKPQFLPEAFAAMQSMKQYGFVPSRALIRSFSIAIRDKRETVDKALQVLLEDHRQAASPSSGESSPLLSLESLNVVMSAYSERGEMENAMDVLNLMEDIDIYPNEDSYSFALEALGKDVVRFQSKEDSSHLHKNVEIAGIILTRMEKNGVEPSVDVIRNYLELLCLAGEVETATSVVEQCLSTNNDRSKINNKSIYRVAMANAEACNFERAKALSKMTSEELPLLDKKIRSLESRFLAMERARELRQSRSDDKLL